MMEKLNKSFDTEKYLKEGALTKPFLSGVIVKEKVFMDFDNKKVSGQQASVLTSLASWILHNIKPATDEKFVQTNKFNRTAEEIWKSGLATGCTDYCTVFATLARQLKIPTTFLHAAEYNWLMKLNAGESFQKNVGHSFCECYCDGKWVLVDPTCGKVIENYNQNIISLPYQVGDSMKFVPYYRALDLGGKQTIKDHNQDMNKKCKNLFH